MSTMHLMCLTTGGGFPLFVRTYGKARHPQFANVASLNAVHLFSVQHEASLLNTHSSNAKVVWKVFHNSITLIIVAHNDKSSDAHLNRLLENVFLAMVLLIGLDDLMSIKGVERLKRELKCTYRLIDYMIEETMTAGNITGCVDVVLSPDQANLQAQLETFVESAADSTYGCILSHGHLVVATKKWWLLTGQELMLLSSLSTCLPKCSARDVPVFLPHGSPTVPHRLLTFRLVSGVEVAVLCGPSPTLPQLRQEVDKYWVHFVEAFKAAALTYPRNFPQSVTVDPNIMGLLLVNTEQCRCLCTVELHDDSPCGLPSDRRMALLKSFYRSVVGRLFHPQWYPHRPPDPTDDMCRRMKHFALETYMCGDGHKSYAMQSSVYQIFLVFRPNIPTFALRSVTLKTLNMLTQSKYIHL